MTVNYHRVEIRLEVWQRIIRKFVDRVGRAVIVATAHFLVLRKGPSNAVGSVVQRPTWPPHRRHLARITTRSPAAAAGETLNLSNRHAADVGCSDWFAVQPDSPYSMYSPHIGQESFVT